MQPFSRVTQAMNPTQQVPLQDLQINVHHDDFLQQMLSTTSFPTSSSFSSSYSDLNAAAAAGFHRDEILASNLRQQQQQQINGGHGGSSNTFQAMKMMMMMQQQQMMVADTAAAGGGAHQGGGEGSTSMQALFNSLGYGSLHHPQASFGTDSTTEVNHTQRPTAAAAAPEKPKQKVRARRGQATDPHSIAERLRRVRIAERMKSLQELVPNANKTDKASMLDEIIDYVKFLQLQVKVLSVSRLGGAAAVAPLATDMPFEGGGDCIQTSANGGSLPRDSNGDRPPLDNESLTTSELQVAKLMEEDMGSAMQFLQGKGLCLMSISLATAISTATSHSRNPMVGNVNPNAGVNGGQLLVHPSGGDGSSSPSLSVLTVQSATMGNGGVDGAASVFKP